MRSIVILVFSFNYTNYYKKIFIIFFFKQNQNLYIIGEEGEEIIEAEPPLDITHIFNDKNSSVEL